jgi:L-ascorbate metabolism protein UlaG (beta-lactamase superfamily)
MDNTTLIIAACIAVVVALVSGPVSAATDRDTIATSDGELVIHPINHATFVMEWNDRTIYVDPVGGADLFADHADPDLILVTHIHGDHTSLETITGVSTQKTLILAPTSVAEKLGGGIPGTLTILANGESFETGGVAVEAVPAYNLAADRQAYHPKQRGDNAYVVALGGIRVFISGDTEATPEMRALENIDAAFVCMNLPYTMTVEEAADGVLEFAPKIVYPYHYRGQDGVSDLDAFVKLVAANPKIEVRLLSWY